MPRRRSDKAAQHGSSESVKPALVWADHAGLAYVEDPVSLSRTKQWPLKPSRLAVKSTVANPSLVPSTASLPESYLMCGRHGGPAPNHTGWNATLERLIVLRGGKTIQDPFDNLEEISTIAGEDPFCYQDATGFHMLFHWFDCNNLYSSVGRHAYSIDGRQWWLSAGAAYNTTVALQDEDSGVQERLTLTRRERPYLVFEWTHDGVAQPVALVTSGQRNFYWWDGPPHCGRHRPTFNSSCDAFTIITRVGGLSNESL